MALTDTRDDTTTQPPFTIPVRLDFDSHAAGFARALAHLDRAATKELDHVDFDPRLRELVRVRASQLNGCAYCVDMHTKDARAVGETEQRLYGLPAAGHRPPALLGWAAGPADRAAACGHDRASRLYAFDHGCDRLWAPAALAGSGSRDRRSAHRWV